MSDAQTLPMDSPKGEVTESGNAAGARKYFLDLLPTAMSEARRIMKTSRNEKLRWEVSRDVIEFAGAGGGPKTAPVVINDSQVQLLLQVGREVLREG